jgi:hypothetical protein
VRACVREHQCQRAASSNHGSTVRHGRRRDPAIFSPGPTSGGVARRFIEWIVSIIYNILDEGAPDGSRLGSTAREARSVTAQGTSGLRVAGASMAGSGGCKVVAARSTLKGPG